MPNDGAPIVPQAGMMREGAPLSAGQLRAVVDMLARRITGDGKTIQVRAFPGGQIVIGALGTPKKSTGSPFSIKRVEALPDIPEAGFLFVIFEGKLWFAFEGYARWYPIDQYTTTTGAV